MDPKEGYWRRQFYLLSSIGIFYIILFALFGIPLLGAFVVVLIKGAMDMRYVIITAGCIAAGVGVWFLIRGIRRLLARMRQNGSMTGEQIRQNLLLGQPMELSVLNGVIKLSCGPAPKAPQPELSHAPLALLPDSTTPDHVVDILDHLDRIAALHRSGIITEEELTLLKSRLTASVEASDASIEQIMVRSARLNHLQPTQSKPKAN
ncbi:hypothetical protein LJC71_08735 [Desulfosarcina sp. OttesenSCG-928-A07]|nr:hypothetical protein [Desulfosarcina sp. OttesenSCG-928-G17]MDL2329812.1 hypothetical protein [Desulfosarcina sp. OttesenSCG-928-A07]